MEPAEELAGLRLQNAVFKRRVEDLILLFRLSSYFYHAKQASDIHALLLTIVTAEHTLGFQRAFLFGVREDENLVEGLLAAATQGAEDSRLLYDRLWVEDVTGDEVLELARERVRDQESARLTDIARRIRLPAKGGGGIIEETVCLRRPLHTWDTSAGLEVNREIRDGLGAGQVVSAPVLADERVLAVLLADNVYTDRPVAPHQLDLLRSLGHQAGRALVRI